VNHFCNCRLIVSSKYYEHHHKYYHIIKPLKSKKSNNLFVISLHMYSISCSLQVECRWGSTFFADFLYELVPPLSNRDAVIVGGCGQVSSSWSDLLTYVKLVIALLHRSHMYEFFKNIFTVTMYLILFLDRARCCSEIMRVNFTVVFVVFELLEIVIRGQSMVKSQRPSVGWGWGSWGRGKNPHIGSLRSVVSSPEVPGAEPPSL